jgi:dTDP-4-dehydrorhamnose 3,5-epimerase
MKITGTPIAGLHCIDPELSEDQRGYFYRWFCKDELELAGIASHEILQANHSYNKAKGTFRGLHAQGAPFAEQKIVKCVKGSVLDITVDLRKGSQTFLNSYLAELSAENHRSMLIPKGCAHGFVTLSDDSELIYLHSQYYNQASEYGFSVFDPLFNLSLPVGIIEISERDRHHPFLSGDFAGVEI